MDVATVLGMKCDELRDELRKLNLSTSGRKDELRNRLLAHHGLSCIDESEDEAVDFVDSVDTVSDRTLNYKVNFTLKDVQDSFTPFTGTDAVTVVDWIKEFEGAANSIGWNELQRFVFGKQLLQGAAKLYLRSQTDVNNWGKLKQSLINEFEKTLSAAEVHAALRNRRKHRDESLLEYLYSLMEIGKGITLDDQSIVEYFIEGVPDSKQNKLVLYQSKDVRELKDAIKVYERMRVPNQPSSRMGTLSDSTGKPVKTELKHEARNQKRCFNCGELTHLAKDCPKTEVKCFKCNKLGHRSFECPRAEGAATRPNEERRRNTNVSMMLGSSNSSRRAGFILKPVMIENYIVEALIDTGCVVSLLRYDTLMMMDDRITLDDRRMELVGIGDGGITTMGSFETKVSADGLQFSLTFHVVAERDLQYTAIIGKTVLNEVDLMVTQEKARFILRRPAGSFIDGRDDVARCKEPQVARCEQPKVDRREQSQPSVWRDWLRENEALCVAAENKIFLQQGESLDIAHLDEEVAREILGIIDSYQPEKTKTAPVSMKLILSDDMPVCQRPRRLPYVHQQVVEGQVSKWLEQGIIKASVSEYSSPVVLVKKKDGTHRLCCDYRLINKKIVKDNFPMPLIDDVVERLQGAAVFTTLDLTDGFFHVPMEESSRKYTSFVTHNGQYEFMYVPFGITNSPAVFTRYIMAVFRDMIKDGLVVIYMDDLIIPTTDVKTGIDKLQRVLQRAAEYGLNIKWKKCQVLQRRVQFLGYIIEDNTIKPSEEKTLAIRNFPQPTTSKALQRFLGLTSYFRRFIENYAVIAKPLSDLLRKDVEYQLGDEQLIAFDQLKSALINAPVMQIYDPEAETEIHTDACRYGYGAVLFQKCPADSSFHPVQYMSRKTKPAEEQYHSYELEVLAIIEALKKWRTYVLGRMVRIVTDCNAFQMTMQKQDVPLRVARWAMFLQEFSYVIEHRSGSKMKHVDALSRVSCMLGEGSLSQRLAEAQETDQWIKAVRKVLEHDEYEDFYLKRGVLYKDPGKELIVVPEPMEHEIIEVAHRQGHYGVKKTQEMVERSFFIPQLQAKITKIIKKCIECIITNEKTGKREGFIFPLDKEDTPLLTLHLDHVGPMEATKKAYNYILVIVDGFTKFVWLYPTKNTGVEAVIN